jgi:hypothetical protein
MMTYLVNEFIIGRKCNVLLRVSAKYRGSRDIHQRIFVQLQSFQTCGMSVFVLRSLK